MMAMTTPALGDASTASLVNCQVERSVDNCLLRSDVDVWLTEARPELLARPKPSRTSWLLRRVNCLLPGCSLRQCGLHFPVLRLSNDLKGTSLDPGPCFRVSPRISSLHAALIEHTTVGLTSVSSEHYEGAHWLER